MKDFLIKFNENLEFDCFFLKDPLDGWSLDYDCLIVSQETEKAVDKFNEMRSKENLKSIRGRTLELLKETNQ